MKNKLWNTFCKEHRILETSVKLFDTNDLFVEIEEYGIDKRKILKRSADMEKLVIREVNKVIQDYNNKTSIYDGLVYIMFKVIDNQVVPLYIGKSEKYGKKNGNLSSNIRNIDKNKAYFCRWGNNYAYHIGDLSACVLSGHSKDKISKKYLRWSDALFKEVKNDKVILKENVCFWIKAWNKDDISIWREYGKTSLTFLEYLLIGVASNVYGDTLLNIEGVNRG